MKACKHLLHSFFLFLILYLPTSLVAQECEPPILLHFGEPDVVCNEIFVDVFIDQLPATLAGVNSSVSIQAGGVSGGYSFHPDTWTSLNANLSGANFEPTGGGLVLAWLPNPPGITLTGNTMELFKIHLIAEEPECIDFSFSGIQAYYEISPFSGGTSCSFTVDEPIQHCFITFTLGGLVETLPPLQCDGSVNHGLENVDIEISNDGSLLCSSTTNEEGEYLCPAFNNCENYRIVPLKESHPDCGVTLLDQQMVHQHVLVYQSLLHPWQMIAADMNPNGAGGHVSSYDVFLIQQLIMGNEDFVYNKGFRSWNFVPSVSYVFMPNPIPPFLFTVPPFDPYLVYPNFQSPLQQQFIGIKLGDVNASCTDCNSDFAPGADSKDELSNAILSINDGSYNRDEIVNLTVHAEEFSNQSVFGMGINLSPEYFEIMDIQQGNYKGTFNWTSDEGMVKLNWFSLDKKGAAIEKDDALFTIKAKVLQSTNSIQDIIRLEPGLSENLLFENNSFEPRQFQLEIGDRKAEEVSVAPTVPSLFPNPFTETTNIHFQLNKPGEVQLLLYDALGNMVLNKTLDLMAGDHKLPVGHSLNSGMYFSKLYTPDGVFSNRLIKID